MICEFEYGETIRIGWAPAGFSGDWNAIMNHPRMQRVRSKDYGHRAANLRNPRRVVPALVAGEETLLSTKEARALGVSDKMMKRYQKYLLHDGRLVNNVEIW